MSRRGGSGKRRRPAEEEHENHERWLVSYSDMVTVLMALFIVLYAISQVDQTKYESLRASLAAGFGVAETSVLPEGAGVMLDTGSTTRFPTVEDLVPNITDGLIPENAQGDIAAAALGQAVGADGEPGTGQDLTSHTPAELEAAERELERLTAIRERILEALERDGTADAVQFRINEQGLVIGMVTTDVYFTPGGYQLSQVSMRVIDTIGPILADLSQEISVEGHADIVPTGAEFETNWELSAARATAVLRRLVEHGNVGPTRIAAVGFGDSRPLVDATDPAALAANRRVDMVVLSSEPERVRVLLPFVEKSKE